MGVADWSTAPQSWNRRHALGDGSAFLAVVFPLCFSSTLHPASTSRLCSYTNPLHSRRPVLGPHPETHTALFSSLLQLHNAACLQLWRVNCTLFCFSRRCSPEKILLVMEAAARSLCLFVPVYAALWKKCTTVFEKQSSWMLSASSSYQQSAVRRNIKCQCASSANGRILSLLLKFQVDFLAEISLNILLLSVHQFSWKI